MTAPYRSVLVLPDIHVPLHDQKSLGAVLDYAREVRWDELVILGDFLDLSMVSRFVVDFPRLRAGQTLRKDADVGAEVLDAILKAVRAKNKTAKATLLEGNHEFRITQMVDRTPELEGLVEVPRLLRLQERGVSWVPFWSKGSLYRVGKAHFAHGRWASKYHAAKHAAEMGCSLIYGHTHDVQVHSQVLLGDDSTIRATSLGCLCLYNQPYLKGAATRWQHAFGELQVFPDGLFQLNVVSLFRHRFVGPRTGRVYQR